MSNRLKTMYNAIQTGSKDSRVGHEPMPEKYHARKGSAWESWYLHGYHNLPFPTELKENGYEQ